MREAESEDGENGHVDHDQRPEAIRGRLGRHQSPPCRGGRPSPPCSPCSPSCPRWKKCSSWHARSKRYGRKPKTWAVCSVMRKNAAMIRKASSASPERDRSHEPALGGGSIVIRSLRLENPAPPRL